MHAAGRWKHSPLHWSGKFAIGVGPSSAVHKVLIGDIEVDGILGMDFLRAQQCKLRLENKVYVLTLPRRPSVMPRDTRELGLSARGNL